ncbi:MAG: hypothetical protein SGARI_001917 [Bacillariaceae sp.]
MNIERDVPYSRAAFGYHFGTRMESQSFPWMACARDLGVYPTNNKVKRSAHHDELFRQDLRELKGMLRIMKTGTTNNKKAATVNDGSKFDQHRTQDGQFASKYKKSKPLSISFLNHAWGVNKNYATRLTNQKAPEPLKADNESTLYTTSMIENYAVAETWFKPKACYIRDAMMVHGDNDDCMAYDNSIRIAKRKDYRVCANESWAMMNNVEKAQWEAFSRKQLLLQPHIRDRLVELMREKAEVSFRQLSEGIDHWCSAATINRWFNSFPDSCQYVQRPLPLLTAKQRAKHSAFAKRYLNKWELPANQKVLLVHYDEKWFYGMVARCNAKMSMLLGVEKQYTHVFHKSHINKVMAVAFTGYAFDGNYEDGGHGLKLGLFRCNGARVAKKQVRQSRRDENDDLKYDGEIVRKKGDVYFVDCNVTGSDEGTSDKPKFSLKRLLDDVMFPYIAELVSRRGEYAGYLPVIQGDNAGPHQDKEFMDYVETQCNELGWKWEPQAPQMPHANNLDLAVFPSMSKHHSALLSGYNKSCEPSTDEIWKCAESVWESMPSATIAKGFMHGHRILQKVVEQNGCNNFLRTKDFHTGVGQDYRPTTKGIEKVIKTEN